MKWLTGLISSFRIWEHQTVTMWALAEGRNGIDRGTPDGRGVRMPEIAAVQGAGPLLPKERHRIVSNLVFPSA